MTRADRRWGSLLKGSQGVNNHKQTIKKRRKQKNNSYWKNKNNYTQEDLHGRNLGIIDNEEYGDILVKNKNNNLHKKLQLNLSTICKPMGWIIKNKSTSQTDQFTPIS